jgi:hypothetical protein
VARTWSRRAAPAWTAVEAASAAGSRNGSLCEQPSGPGRPPLLQRLLPASLYNPEIVPLGEHGPRLPHAMRAARRVLAAHGDCQAIVVNADPYAATLVGARLARESGLPLVLDLRDPWAPCELRRPRRPLPVRLLEDRLERHVVTRASRVILNSRLSCEDYRRFYPDLPGARFTWIRNSVDPELIACGCHPGFDRFTLLFLGNFGRFVTATPFLRALARLRSQGLPADAVQLAICGRLPRDGWEQARELGVADLLRLHPHVPYREIGAIIAAADLLVAQTQPGVRQRIAAKVFDYLAGPRPILVVGDNSELAEILSAEAGDAVVPHGREEDLAAQIGRQLARGRGAAVARPLDAHSARAASRALAEVLEQATS